MTSFPLRSNPAGRYCGLREPGGLRADPEHTAPGGGTDPAARVGSPCSLICPPSKMMLACLLVKGAHDFIPNSSLLTFTILLWQTNPLWQLPKNKLMVWLNSYVVQKIYIRDQEILRDSGMEEEGVDVIICVGVTPRDLLDRRMSLLL